MNQKGFTNTVLIVVIIVLVGVVGYFILHKLSVQPILPIIGQSPTTRNIPLTTSQTPSSTIIGDMFFMDIDGYFETCMDTSTIYKSINSSWEKVSTKLPGKGLYYLDDKFFGYSMCDLVVCTELSKPYTIQLVEYNKVGEKAPPSNSGSTVKVLPVYQATQLSGDIKVDIQYFSDKNCRNKKNFSTIIKK